MKTNTETLKADNGQFIDTACTIEFEGKSFTNSGAFIGKDAAGKLGGCLYGDYKHETIGNWDGSIKIPATYYGFHRGNMNDKRCFVRFTYEGHNYFGRWFGLEWTQIVRVRECK